MFTLRCTCSTPYVSQQQQGESAGSAPQAQTGGPWISLEEGGAASGEHAGSGGGYWDEHGNWIELPQGTQMGVGGYYDAEGNWVAAGETATAAGAQGGYWDEQGNWVDGAAPGDGNYNQQGMWSQQGGYWDEHGNWVQQQHDQQQ